jgi:predicted phage-related endonuclease
MPDPTKQTLSATQTPALFGASPYLTRWMLLRHFIHGDAIDSPEHNRMDWGKKLQPLVLAQAAEDLRLEVRPNADDTYIRRGLLGCTRDAEIICPDRGPGSLETKCVFDYGVWMQAWDGGKTLPRHNEIQLQQQMIVGDGEHNHEWGIMAVWVCGEMKYFERQIIDDLWREIEKEAALFFADVEAKNEGQPFGEPVEMPLLSELFPVRAGTSVDFSNHPKANQLAEQVRSIEKFGEARLFNEKAERAVKSLLKALMQDAEEATFLHGIKVRQKQISRAGYSVKPSSYATLEVYVPENLPDDLVS